jgi:hypothetical protein
MVSSNKSRRQRGTASICVDTLSVEKLSLSAIPPPATINDAFSEQLDFIAFDTNPNLMVPSLKKPPKNSVKRANQAASLADISHNSFMIPSVIAASQKKNDTGKKKQQKNKMPAPSHPSRPAKNPSTFFPLLSIEEGHPSPMNSVKTYETTLRQLKSYLEGCGVSLKIYNTFIEELNAFDNNENKFLPMPYAFPLLHEDAAEPLSPTPDLLSPNEQQFLPDQKPDLQESIDESEDALTSGLSQYGNILEDSLEIESICSTESSLERSNENLEYDLDTKLHRSRLNHENKLVWMQENLQDDMYELNREESGASPLEFLRDEESFDMESAFFQNHDWTTNILDTLHMDTLKRHKKQKQVSRKKCERVLKKNHMAGASEAGGQNLVNFVEINREIKRFLQDMDEQELSLQSMNACQRQYVHKLASCYNLKSRSRGKGNHRFTVLYRMKYSTAINHNWSKIEAIIRQAERDQKTFLSFMSSSSLKKTNRVSLGKKERTTSKTRDKLIIEEPIASTNIGNRMLQKLGWTPGAGLGQEGQGLKEPIPLVIRRKNAGLGT